MNFLIFAVCLPRVRALLSPKHGAAHGELAALHDRVIADLGMLWCDLAYYEHGAPPTA